MSRPGIKSDKLEVSFNQSKKHLTPSKQKATKQQETLSLVPITLHNLLSCGRASAGQYVVV